MAMNTRDFRLYHYEFRRPRLSNPTYNSTGIYDSLSLLVNHRQNRNPSLYHSVVYQRMTDPYDRGQPFSLGTTVKKQMKPEMFMNNHSMDFSSLKNAKDPSWLQQKDYQYQKIIDQSKKRKQSQDQKSRASSSRSQNMNPQKSNETKNNNQYSLHKGLEQFTNQKR